MPYGLLMGFFRPYAWPFGDDCSLLTSFEESQSVHPLNSVQYRRAQAILNLNAKRNVTLAPFTIDINTSLPGSEYGHFLVMVADEYSTGLPRIFTPAVCRGVPAPMASANVIVGEAGQ
jgi:hypothetical protein